MVVVVPVPTVCLCLGGGCAKAVVLLCRRNAAAVDSRRYDPTQLYGSNEHANLRPVWVYSLKQEEM